MVDHFELFQTCRAVAGLRPRVQFYQFVQNRPGQTNPVLHAFFFHWPQHFLPMYGNTSHHESFVTEYWVKVKDKKYTKCLFSVSFYLKGTLEKLCCHWTKVLPSFLGGFISISLITLIYQMCLWWQLLWLIRVKKKKKNPLCPEVNPCRTTKPQLVAFGASGLSPFVISCVVTGFVFSSQSFAPEWVPFFWGSFFLCVSLLHDGVHWKPRVVKRRQGGKEGSMINSISRM